MNVVITTLCFFIGTAAGWGITLRRVSGEISCAQESADYWQNEAARAHFEAQRLAQESATYAAGCKQGQEEVISLVTLLTRTPEKLGSAHDPAGIDSASKLNRPLDSGARGDI